MPTDPGQLRREHGMMPPEAEVTLYQVIVRARLERFQTALLSVVDTELRQDASENFLRRVRELRTGIDADAIGEAGQRVARKNAREFTRVFGLRVRGLEPGIDRRITEFRERNVQLIRSLEDQQIQELTGMLDAGLERGTHANDLRKQIQERFEVSRSKADLLARDQVLKLNAAITKDRQVRAGVKRYRWITSRDERVRGNPSGLYPVDKGNSNHWALHGRVFSWDDPPVTDPRTGRRAHPGQDIECRCVAVPEIEQLTSEDEALFESALE